MLRIAFLTAAVLANCTVAASNGDCGQGVLGRHAGVASQDAPLNSEARFCPAVARYWPQVCSGDLVKRASSAFTSAGVKRARCAFYQLARDLLIVGVEDKEWMDSIGPDDEIVVDKKILGGILGTLPLIPKRGIVVGCAIW